MKYKNYKEYYKKYLGGWSFEDGDRVLTISKIDEEEMFDAESGGKKKGLVMYFKEEQLPAVLNITNCETIEKVVGSDKFSDWIGKKIIVGQSPVRAFGEVYKALRVRDEKPDTTEYICEECGKTIMPAARKQPRELAEISKRNTGRILCIDCMRKAAEQKKEETA